MLEHLLITLENGCEDGDNDGFGGSMTIGNFDFESNCNIPKSDKVLNKKFLNDLNSITITQLNQKHDCNLSLNKLSISQKVPFSQADGKYSIDLTITETIY